ncbi:MAG: asparagine synthase (glutamine-hydrolyzing) [Acidobacteria bacterium]|nr:asparagine synthase (glutamine-hydrolyzing) [Acidobacteriota bacterium]
MCGIAGWIGRNDEVADAAGVHRMCQTIVHRGPDDEGLYARGPAGLGMRRLSIIDLSGGHQPIHNEEKNIWVVFNGEIYNFPELRKQLEDRGHRFYTHSDTEVIVHLYEEMGADCVTKLRGMFAIALWDERAQSLLLARDRLGKKPLYYAQHGGRLYFGSEIKAILAVEPSLADVDPEGVLKFFYFGYVPDPNSAFRAVHKLPPGHLLEYQAGKIQVRRYWDLPAFGSQAPASEEECLEELERRLAEAVRIRLISDVPLGALLSGGVDSSLVVALMARASSRPVKTFSIGFREQKFNEAEYARLVAERFGTEHHELVVEPNLDETLEFLTRSLEEPFADSSMLPTYYVCQMARKYVTVALSGDGGDELFAGYDRYAVDAQRSKLDWLPGWAGRLYRGLLHSHLPSGTYGKNFAWNASLPPRDRYLDSISYLPGLDRERSVFAEDFLQSVAGLPNPMQQFREYYDSAPAGSHLERLLYLDVKTYLAGDILTKVDRMSMATSLEARVPMLDHVFVEWVAALPAEWKFRHGTRKYLLKKLAERVGVPRALLHRPKQGFQLPLEAWMKGEMKQKLYGLLLEPRTLQRGYFRPQAVQSMVEEHLRGRRDRSSVLWQMLVLELWQRNFLERQPGVPSEAMSPAVS